MSKNDTSQRLLFDLPTEQPFPVLILSIRAMHVDRIFQGTKLFELRKTLPKTHFRRVYLYETGTGKGIVGCFDVKRIYDSVPVDDLWQIVGELGTIKERFDKYFEERPYGCAIEISNPIKFRESVIPPTLKNKKQNFQAPMSYVTLTPNENLYAYLEAKRVAEMGLRQIQLRLIEPSEYSTYKNIVTEEIAKNYDEITESFAESILRSHQLGYDPRGIFTIKKEVYSIIAEPNLLIGFTTLTYKIGGATKTGPTILFNEFRNNNYGKAVRKLIEAICKKKGSRKLYCTCADHQPGVLKYLLNGDMRVEAHLTDHYSASHGEFVLGKMITASPTVHEAPERSFGMECTLAEPHDFDHETLVDVIMAHLQASGYDIDADRSRSILDSAKAVGVKGYEDKPLSMLCLKSQADCVGFSILIPKRGGLVKAIVACSTSHSGSIDTLIVQSELEIRKLRKRKIYVNHRFSDSLVIERLIFHGFEVEGILKQPYKSGVDHIILSKKLA